jgi:hypothetical protein
MLSRGRRGEHDNLRGAMIIFDAKNPRKAWPSSKVIKIITLFLRFGPMSPCGDAFISKAVGS